ncbi:haloacid dehalogenase type II [Chthonobacter albigriseus]|uniref:haloacid dehalogenase type II n=1 Tax=Chthonobacter albigriseus TaxID=1683161 RepID=UPI0015EF5179|nr:haloacid dehalogenase type II [Chthonobacter albigriseus]
MAFAIYVFDAYGTLFDVHAAVRRHAAAMGPEAQRLSELWRAKQLEYSWVRSMSGTYRDFWRLTEDALDTALAAFPSADRSLRDSLLDAYRTLDCYPEVPQLLKDLKAQNAKIAILSNGSPKMLDQAVRAAGLQDLIDDVLSVDQIRIYKPDPQVYEIATTHYRVFPSAISFQSSNRWDVAGATKFGFRTVWINRSGAADEYPDMPPAAVLRDLGGLTVLG